MSEWIKATEILKKIETGIVGIGVNFTIPSIKANTKYDIFFSINSCEITSMERTELGADLITVNTNTFRFDSVNKSQTIRWGAFIYYE